MLGQSMDFEHHYINRSGWLRAAVLGANDGILSTTSLAIGVAAAGQPREAIILASLAGLVAGALSMAAGEYVSVSSQADVERADLERERHELEDNPDVELEELIQIYEHRGLERDLARQVAVALTEHNALETHARDELGINEITQAKPFQAALTSALAFLSGGLLPLLVSFFAPVNAMVWWQYALAIVFLAISGSVAARTGGSPLPKAILRICFWGTFAMLMSALVGHLFHVSVN